MNNKNLLTSTPQDKLNYLKTLDFQVKDKLKNGTSYLLAPPEGPKVVSWMQEKFGFVYV